MSVDEVQRLIRDGAVSTKQEEGFTFVDVAPESPTMDGPKLAVERRSKENSPTTIPASDDAEVSVMVADDGNGDLMADETHPDDFGDWRKSRARVSRTRIGPPRRLSA